MDIQNSIAGILNEDREIIGTGFLVSDKTILTCAHVVEAIKHEQKGQVDVRFAFDSSETLASLDEKLWSPVEEHDLALLHIEQRPENATPLSLGASSGTSGHTFRTYGYAKVGGIQGVGARGEIIDVVDNGDLLQITSQEIDRGFSGAPIIDEARRVVVGMITWGKISTTSQRGRDTTFAITTEAIQKVVPELEFSDICPYRSLDVFTEEDAEFFYGRQRVVERLLDSLKREPRFLAVLGPSGSGKSSVVRAGLVPALKDGKLPSSRKWGVLTVRPGEQPFEQLAGVGLVSDAENDLIEAVKGWLVSHPEHSRLVLVIDQFEELLVNVPEDVRQTFITQLAELLDAPVDLSLVLTMRDDFYSRFIQAADELVTWIQHSQIIIPPTLHEDELRQMIVEPAHQVGLKFEEGLVDTIIADTLETEGSTRCTILPLLEFLLTHLWEIRRYGLMAHSAYRNLGGVSGSLAMWADRIYYSLEPDERVQARFVLGQLVHPGDDSLRIPGTRQSRVLSEIIDQPESVTSKTIDKLIQARLLTSTRDYTDTQIHIEIIHETLLKEWKLLSKWLEEDRAELLLHNQLLTDVLQWNKSNRDKGYLYQGSRLAIVASWADQNLKKLSRDEQKFLQASVEERKKQRIQKGLFLTFLVVIIGLLVFFGPGQWSYKLYLRERAKNASELVEIGGGEIIFGAADEERVPLEGEPKLQSVYVATFQMERTEVTNWQYKQCTSVGACQPPFNREYFDRPEYQNYPVVYITAFQASEYCQWVDRRLPTTYEWERAARGIAGNPWPWFDTSLAAENPSNQVSSDKGNFILVDRYPTGAEPVGSYPEGRNQEGILDLYGNVWEWTSTSLDMESEVLSNWDFEGKQILIQRGGSWDSMLDRITQVRLAYPDDSAPSVGFRCVQSEP